MVDKNDSLLREVEDELRRDQLKKLWDQYGTFLIGGAVALVAAVGIYQSVESSRLAAAEAAGARYEAARRLVADNKTDDANTAFGQIAKDGPAGYAALARLQSAGALAKADKTAEAVAAYDAIVADSAADSVLRDLAALQAAALKLGTADFAELQNRLKSLVDERSAFRPTARELLGMGALKAGQPDEARRLFLQVLSDSKASQSAKDRVNAQLVVLTAAALEKAAAVPAPAAAPSAGDQKK